MIGRYADRNSNQQGLPFRWFSDHYATNAIPAARCYCCIARVRSGIAVQGPEWV
jgi:hypothetical protein